MNANRGVFCLVESARREGDIRISPRSQMNANRGVCLGKQFATGMTRNEIIRLHFLSQAPD
jgi:hypothetical protein